MAASHLSLAPGLSSETPTMVNFWFLNRLKAFTTFGFSCRQGPHHDAQKSMSTYFPLNDDRFTIFPLVSASANSGATAPKATAFNFGSLSANFFPFSDSFIVAERLLNNGAISV